jgi:hypothetical protein
VAAAAALAMVRRAVMRLELREVTALMAEWCNGVVLVLDNRY